jgi:hypothetical protein
MCTTTHDDDYDDRDDDDGIQWFWSEVKITFKLRKKK